MGTKGKGTPLGKGIPLGKGKGTPLGTEGKDTPLGTKFMVVGVNWLRDFFLSHQGVPLRVELGPRDVELKQFVSVTRDVWGRETHPLEEAPNRIKKILEDMHCRMLDR